MSETSPSAPAPMHSEQTAPSTSVLWVLLGVVGRFISVELPNASSGRAQTVPMMADVAEALQAILQKTMTCTQMREETRHHDSDEELVDVDTPVVRMDFYDTVTKNFAEPQDEVRCDGRLILFCQPAKAEEVLAENCPNALRPNDEPSDESQAEIFVINNLLASFQSVRRVADQTLSRCQELTASVDAGVRDAQAKLLALQEYRTSLLLASSASTGTTPWGSFSGPVDKAKKKEHPGKQLKAGIKVATEALERATAARSSAGEVLRRQGNLLTLISLDISLPSDVEGCTSPATMAPTAVTERVSYLRACLTSALTVLRGCLADAEEVAGYLEESATALEMVTMVYDRFEDTERRPQARVHAQALRHRRLVLTQATRTLLQALEGHRRQLAADTEQFVGSSDFALLSAEERDQVREPLVSSLDNLSTAIDDDGGSEAEVEALLTSCGIRYHPCESGA